MPYDIAIAAYWVGVANIVIGAILVAVGLTILCRPCRKRHQAEGETVTRMPLQPEQLEERRRREKEKP